MNILLQNEDTTQPDDRTQLPQTGDGKSAGDSTTGTPDPSKQTYSYYEKVYDEPNWFWYGFLQGIIQFFCGINQALAVDMSWDFSDAWDDYWANQYTLVIRSDVTDGYSAEDLDALRQAGLDENDIYDITHPRTVDSGQWSVDSSGAQKPEANTTISTPGEKQKPEYGGEKAKPEAPENNRQSSIVNRQSDDPIIIPAFPDEQTRIDYELTYYVNDVNLANTQVLMEYGKRNEVKNVYTYGTQRLDARRVDGSLDTHLYDGRGSVAQAVSIDDGQLTIDDGQLTIDNYGYAPYGEMSGNDPYALIYGYNGEEYNPVTGLVYLRARYYNVETGTFITEDSFLGADDNISSQNRYAYGEGDPVNHIDPTGHFTSLITQQAGWQADYWSGRFDSYAGGQVKNQTNATGKYSYNNYTISDNTANSYAKNGGNAARGLCASYNCIPGSQVEKAIADMEQKIKETQKSANGQIKGIRDNNVKEWDNSPDNPKNKPKQTGGITNGGGGNGNGGSTVYSDNKGGLSNADYAAKLKKQFNDYNEYVKFICVNGTNESVYKNWSDKQRVDYVRYRENNALVRVYSAMAIKLTSILQILLQDRNL